jgi:hypothetical protein
MIAARSRRPKVHASRQKLKLDEKTRWDIARDGE